MPVLTAEQASTAQQDAPAGDLDAFRLSTRAWLAENCPLSMRTGSAISVAASSLTWGGGKTVYANPDAPLWMSRMANRGWTAPRWPTQYGGGGLSEDEAAILQEELDRIEAAPALVGAGVWMLGPALLEFGTEAQKAQHLPAITQGRVRWAQGYSEPNAGSDLASLATQAVDCGDHFKVTGQKVWTSFAEQCDWIFCLVRTDKTRKQGGISLLLIDLATPGVTVKPIKLISGSSPFCETFFTDAVVPKGNLIGEMNAGWTIAKKILQYERNNISSIGFGGEREDEILDWALKYVGVDGHGRLNDHDLRTRITAQKMGAQALDLTVARISEGIATGALPGTITSILKCTAARINQERCELLLEILGAQGLGGEGLGGEGLGGEGSGFSPDEATTTREWLRSKANSIEGGTSEINLNIISKRILGLPDAAAPSQQPR